jgi:Spy/CpxP family protein refolding chaperone
MKRLMLSFVAAGLMLAPMALAATPEKLAGPGHERMGKMLGLTKDQMAKFKAISVEQRKIMQPLRESMETQMKELKELVDAKADDAKLTAKLDQIKQTRDSIDTNQKKFQEQRDAVLTPMQRAKSALTMGRMGRQGGEGMGPRGDRKQWGEGKEEKE